MANNTNHPNSLYDKIRLMEYEDFLEYLNVIGSESTSQEELDELYEEQVTIEFNHHRVDIPFDAVIYHELLNLMNTIIKEY